MTRLWWRCFGPACASMLLSFGCGEDDKEPGGSGSGGDTDEVEETGANTGDNDEDGNETGADDSGIDPDYEQIPARDIQISRMALNQGVRVPIVENGAWIGPEGRAVSVVRNRPALVRAFWDIPENWEPRKIQGRLYIGNGTGEEIMKSAVVDVQGETFDGDLSRSFSWLIEAEEAVPGLTFRVELWEAAPGQEDKPEPNPLPVSPIDGSAPLLGVEEKAMGLSVTIVPVSVDEGRCQTTPEITEEREELFNRYMYEMNPLSTLDLRIAPVAGPVTYQMSSMADLWIYGSAQKSADGGNATQYYYVTADACTGDVGGAGGIAGGGGISSGLFFNPEGRFAYEIMVHEVGHTQGRPHTPGCEAGGPDYAYPHEGGRIGTWGFGVWGYSLHNPTGSFDYMSYCSPKWVSEWTWNATRETIDWLSGPSGRNDERAPVLVGLELPDGSQKWYTDMRHLDVPGEHDDVEGETFDFTTGDGKILSFDAHRHAHIDGTVEVVVPTPEDFDDSIVEIHRFGPRGANEVSVGDITKFNWAR